MIDTADPSTSTVSAALRVLAVVALLAQAGVHLQQWMAGISQIAIVGPMFLANAAVAGLAAVGVALSRHWLPAVGGIAVSVGALIALAMAFTGGLFGYQTAGTTRVPILVAVISEVVATVALGAWLATRGS